MGGSLNPNFYKVHVNLAVLVGPVACTANIPSPLIRFAASYIKQLTFFIVDILGYYNWLGPRPILVEGLEAFCYFETSVC